MSIAQRFGYRRAALLLNDAVPHQNLPLLVGCAPHQRWLGKPRLKVSSYPKILGQRDALIRHQHGDSCIRVHRAKFIAELLTFADRDFSGFDIQTLFGNEHARAPRVGCRGTIKKKHQVLPPCQRR